MFDLNEFVGKNVSIKYKDGRCFKGLLEKWFFCDFEDGSKGYTFNIRDVKHNILHWDIESIKEVEVK